MLRHSVKDPEVGAGPLPVNDEVDDGLEEAPGEEEPELVAEVEVEIAESGSALIVETFPAMVVSCGVMVATGMPFETDIQGVSCPAVAEVVGPVVDADELVDDVVARQGVASITYARGCTS